MKICQHKEVLNLIDETTKKISWCADCGSLRYSAQVTGKEVIGWMAPNNGSDAMGEIKELLRRALRGWTMELNDSGRSVMHPHGYNDVHRRAANEGIKVRRADTVSIS